MTDRLTIFQRIERGEILTDADFAKCNGVANIARKYYRQKQDGIPAHKRAEVLVEAKFTESDIHAIMSEPEQQSDDSDRFREKYLKHLFSAKDTLKPLPPIDWAINEVIAFGGLMGVFGKPGSKKSFLMLSLAVHMATGRQWLDYRVKQCPVLWIDEDSGKNRTWRRLQLAQRGIEITDQDTEIPMNIISLAGVNIVDPQGASDLERLILHTSAKFVVIDTLADVCIGAAIISPDDMQEPLRQLRQIAERTGALICFIYHTNKAGDFLGAINISGKVDLLLQIESASDSDIIKCESVKSRDTGAIKFAAQSRLGDGFFYLVDCDRTALDAAARIKQMTGANKFVYEYLNSNGKSSIDDMLADTELHKRGAIERAINRLIEDGIIERLDGGKRGIKGMYGVKST